MDLVPIGHKRPELVPVNTHASIIVPCRSTAQGRRSGILHRGLPQPAYTPPARSRWPWPGRGGGTAAPGRKARSQRGLRLDAARRWRTPPFISSPLARSHTQRPRSTWDWTSCPHPGSASTGLAAGASSNASGRGSGYGSGRGTGSGSGWGSGGGNGCGCGRGSGGGAGGSGSGPGGGPGGRAGPGGAGCGGGTGGGCGGGTGGGSTGSGRVGPGRPGLGPAAISAPGTEGRQDEGFAGTPKLFPAGAVPTALRAVLSGPPQVGAHSPKLA